MTTFDGEKIYYTNQKFTTDEEFNHESTITDAGKRILKFLKEFHFQDKFIYRDQLKENVANNEYILRVEINDIENSDKELYSFILDRPQDIQETFEDKIKELYSQEKMINKSDCPDFQLQLISQQNPDLLRNLTAQQIGKLVTIKCIISASKSIKVKAKKLLIRCRECQDEQNINLGYGPKPVNLPRYCLGKAQQKGAQTDAQCPTDPYVIIPEECQFIDQQTLRIQELSEAIPTGEVPRNFMVYCDRYLVNKLIPGQRVIITGVYQVPPKGSATIKSNAIDAELLLPYIHVFGVQTNKVNIKQALSEALRQEFKSLSRNRDVYKIITNSIAPAIYGHEDIKLAIACLLFGGTSKNLPDSMKLRGDINVLLIGDPSTAKSQLLKFVERAADISVYTSGKGSSAAGLTATITYQHNTSQFTLEAGALVLASGGVCCIDEFDKMRSEDRVAMHEAMEQQTISIAKAGITTRLNAKCSILAAANPIFGRYQENKSIQEQIELQTTILSRFDNIFIIRDVRSIENDQRLANHIISLHTGQFADQEGMQIEQDSNNSMDLMKLKQYIKYAKSIVKPLLTEQAAQMIQNLYVDDRQISQQPHHSKSGGKSHIPITVRQLEAIIRISESLAKMQLLEHVKEEHVKEAHRLFQISTMMAVSLGSKEFGLDLSNDLKQLVAKIEESILRRISIGSKLPANRLIQELSDRFNNQRAVEFAIHNLIQTEQLQQVEMKRMLIRKK
ncbi:unnamed protein product (macronuclear) [Paramecium tetraurelia]|uniref:DNA replication licensing factor MCM5 n=1 Tax=Paramecium tetraurelia TaxID=5888 RepID=A0BS22_PARTE|nr:uncharacterized protein GSPATT00031570001 [Paramecium tetraurelia]CAK61339.1 unnamed protein product [Paramecium tetraurelia]|eukprot:XP_001428737.1 hypothetical protein (macronuclear) [Paramecium tetraurelia strain d4-2]